MIEYDGGFYADNSTTVMGDIRIQGGYGSEDIAIGTIRTIIDAIKSKNLYLSDLKISCSFQNIEPSTTKDIIIDREDFDRITGHQYVYDEGMRRILKFLSDHAYVIMQIEKTRIFIENFLSIYDEVYTESSVDKYYPSDNSFNIYDDPLDINQYFRHNKIPYELQKVSTLMMRPKYQLTRKYLIQC